MAASDLVQGWCEQCINGALARRVDPVFSGHRRIAVPPDAGGRDPPVRKNPRAASPAADAGTIMRPGQAGVAVGVHAGEPGFHGRVAAAAFVLALLFVGPGHAGLVGADLEPQGGQVCCVAEQGDGLRQPPEAAMAACSRSSSASRSPTVMTVTA